MSLKSCHGDWFSLWSLFVVSSFCRPRGQFRLRHFSSSEMKLHLCRCGGSGGCCDATPILKLSVEFKKWRGRWGEGGSRGASEALVMERAATEWGKNPDRCKNSNINILITIFVLRRQKIIVSLNFSDGSVFEVNFNHAGVEYLLINNLVRSTRWDRSKFANSRQICVLLALQNNIFHYHQTIRSNRKWITKEISGQEKKTTIFGSLTISKQLN